MTKVMLFGACGFMGKEVIQASKNNKLVQIVAGVDKEDTTIDGVEIFSSPDNFDGKIDVIIDFSHPSAFEGIADFARKKKIPVTFCTTGYNEQTLAQMQELSKEFAVFKSANMSLGINLLSRLAKIATAVLQGYDIEMIEKHHNRKIDAPSGTAKLLFDALKTVKTDAVPIYDRSNLRQRRTPSEIGISAIRGGNIVGDHEILFIGENESITLSHSASSRAVFAEGALVASNFMKGKTPALYSMDDIF